MSNFNHEFSNYQINLRLKIYLQEMKSTKITFKIKKNEKLQDYLLYLTIFLK